MTYIKYIIIYVDISSLTNKVEEHCAFPSLLSLICGYLRIFSKSFLRAQGKIDTSYPHCYSLAHTTTNDMISSCLLTVSNYPALFKHEEGLSSSSSSLSNATSTAFDVTTWLAYLEDIDDVLDVMNDYININNDNSYMIGRRDDEEEEGDNDGVKKKKKKKKDGSMTAKTTTIEGGGRIFHISDAVAPGITHCNTSFCEEMRELNKVRIIVGERAASLLPGSYKIWKNHLSFYVTLIAKTEEEGGDGKYGNVVPHYHLASSSSSTTTATTTTTRYTNLYNTIVATYERSLVRLHRMPYIWLNYAAFVATYNPTYNPTTVRHIYDRALLSLPVTQHDRIWEDYIFWITGLLPTSSTDDNDVDNSGGGTATTTRVGGGRRNNYHKVKYGFDSPLVSSWRKRGWYTTTTTSSSSNNNNNTAAAAATTIITTVPTETAIRILRRYTTCYDNNYIETMAMLCITKYSRYGEAASLLLQLLNNNNNLGGGGFISPNGTTRHELWLRFADVCTQYPHEAKIAGVDFDCIIRAVLQRGGGGEGKGGTTSLVIGNSNSSSSSSGGILRNDTAVNFDLVDENNKDLSSSSSSDFIISHGLGEMEGTLWTRLAEYHIRSGNFELARSIYEEALDAITRVRDFSLVFDAYVKFEEGVIEAMMEIMEDDDNDEEEEEGEEEKEVKAKDDSVTTAATNDDDEDMDILLGDGMIKTSSSTNNNNHDDEHNNNEGSSADVDLAISRAEHLTSRRPLLLNRVLLRQNPHNVGEWVKRSKLFLDLNEIDMAASSLEESLKVVSSRKCVNGSPSTLVLTLVNIHEYQRKDVDTARNIYDRICVNMEYEFHDPEDLAQCHASWVELELRQENWDMALNLARRAVSGRVGGGNKGVSSSSSNSSSSSKAVRGLPRSLRLWNLLFDLEESLGTVQTTKDAYDRAFELKVVTPSHVLNYASFLKDKKYFEESFAAYERGLGLFPFPHAGATVLWKNYLTNFLERYDGSKTPRVRELFNRCLNECPAEESPEFFILYGDYEETHGLTKRALQVYERMCNTVPPSERYTAYRLYIAKAIQYLGVTSARPIYETAISALEDGPASRICLEYAKMETGLREIDRARTVLIYGSQLADPRRDPNYWKIWHEFEVSYGNEETFREMLRVKRSVQAAFSTVNYNAAEMGASLPQVDTMTEDDAMEMIRQEAEREGVSLEKKPVVGGFVQSKKRTTDTMLDLGEVEQRAARLREAATAAAGGGGGEIDIDDED